MISILLPSAVGELAVQIQQVLRLAREKGFFVDDIEFGVSPSQQVLISQPGSETVIGCDLWPCSGDECDIYTQYLELPLCSNLAADIVYLGVQDEGRYLDVWTDPIGGDKRALDYADKSLQVNHSNHFAWLIALLSLEFPLEDALSIARAKANVSRETWPVEYQHFPTPVLEHQQLGISVGWNASTQLNRFGDVNRDRLGLYPVVDSADWVEKLLQSGVKTIQLRIKDANCPTLEQQIITAIKLGRKHQAQVFINDYWQLAIKHQAYGVHLGQEDLEVANISQLRQAGIRLGLSTHGYYELLRIVQLKPSYIALGHIFPTTTKQMPSKPQGLVRLGLYQTLIDSIPRGDHPNPVDNYGYPTVAIGGIDLSNAEQVLQCGVTSLAVVRAITLAESPQEVIAQFEQVMQQLLPAARESCDAQ